MACAAAAARVASEVTSRGTTVSRFSYEDDEEEEVVVVVGGGGERLARSRALTPSGSWRAVARMGRVVRCRRCRVRVKPMPRLEGVTKAHGWDILVLMYCMLSTESCCICR